MGFFRINTAIVNSIWLLALTFVLAAVSRADDDQCDSVHLEMFDFEPQQTELKDDYGPKIPKIYPQSGPSSKRNGLQPLITTLFNVHTKEALPIFERPKPDSQMLREFFRCRGFGEQIDMDARLIEAITGAAKHFEAKRASIISGYRSQKFNDTLAKKGRRVAEESRHMKGQAIDFRLDTAEAEVLGKWLWDNYEGGIGTYVGDNFVHIDVGAKRRWRER